MANVKQANRLINNSSVNGTMDEKDRKQKCETEREKKKESTKAHEN